MGHFATFQDFIAMGGHGLYVWLSYAIAVFVIFYNCVSVWLKRRRFFIDAKRRLRRDSSTL